MDPLPVACDAHDGGGSSGHWIKDVKGLASHAADLAVSRRERFCGDDFFWNRGREIGPWGWEIDRNLGSLHFFERSDLTRGGLGGEAPHCVCR